MDSRFTVTVISQTPNPQQVVYAAAHQDYSEGFVSDERDRWPSEEKAGAAIVKMLLAGNKGHFGSLEHPQIVLNFGWFPHSTMQQMRTHRTGVSFDVQCLSASSVITFVNTIGQSSPILKKTIGDLYDLWHNGEKAIRTRPSANGSEPYRRDCKTRIKKMRVRSLDEKSNTFVSNHIEDVVFNGLNPIYKVTFADGKVLECTQNHKIYTPYGWRVLAQLSVGSYAMANGIPLANADKTYQNKEWLERHFSNGLKPKNIAALAGCSAEAVKKWAYFHGLTWEKSQWNKGISYSISISPQERERRREHGRRVTAQRVAEGRIPSGADHPSWNPDIPVGKKVYNWLKTNRDRILREKGGACIDCGETKRLHIHHIKEVSKHPELAYDEENLALLCPSCHTRHHKTGTSNPLCAHPVKIIAIEYKGLEPTYDLVMKAPHHNFVANGIVVHNSFRYTGSRIYDLGVLCQSAFGRFDTLSDALPDGFDTEIEECFYLRPVGHYTDRSGKRYEYTQKMRVADLVRCGEAAMHYTNQIEQGLSEEHARGLIPFDVRQHWVMSANARSLMHLLDLRSPANAQLECQQLCELILPHFQAWMPDVADWYIKNRWKKPRLAP